VLSREQNFASLVCNPKVNGCKFINKLDNAKGEMYNHKLYTGASAKVWMECVNSIFCKFIKMSVLEITFS